MRRLYTDTTSAKPDMTPMMDIVFIMLIFFIVTASFIKEPGFEVTHPANEPPITQNLAQPLHVEITESNILRIDGRNVDAWAAMALMKEQQAAAPSLPVVLSPHPSSNMRTLIRLYDAARSIGLTKEKIMIK